MKAIKINPITREITEVQIENTLEAWYKELDCNMVEAVILKRSQPHGMPVEVLYVDEEGLLREPTLPAFAWRHNERVSITLVGHGLIMGVDEEGDSRDTGYTLEEVKQKIVF